MKRLVLVLVALAAACGSSPAPAPSPPPEGDTHFVVSLSEARATGRLVGWNLGRGTLYAAGSDPLHPEWRTPERAAAIAKLASVHAPFGAPPWVRWSGLQIDGALGADGYHFWDFVRPDHAPKPTDNMASFEVMTAVAELGGDPLVTLDFASGKAREAADYAKHLDGTDVHDPLVAARALWGHARPFEVSHFEIGNEVYGYWNTGFSAAGDFSYANAKAKNGGDPPWFGKPSSSPEAFAARALAYVHAVRAVVPDAVFWVPLTQASMSAWGGLDKAIPALRPLLEEPAVEAVVVHHYLVDDAATLGVSRDVERRFVLGGVELFRPLFADLRVRLGALERATPLAIAVTEYHVAGAFSHGVFDLGDSAILGPAIADMLLTYADLGVEHVAQHLTLAFDEGAGSDLLVERWYNPFRAEGGGTVRAMPTYRATSLVASALRERTIPLAPKRGATLAIDDAKALSAAAIHATAFASADGASMTLAIVSRDIQNPHEVTFDVGDEGWSVRGATTLASSDPYADATKATYATSDVKASIAVGRARVTVAPASVTVVELAR